MIKLADSEESYNLVVDISIILEIFWNSFADVFRRFDWEKVNHNNTKRGRNQYKTQESQSHCSNDFAQLILLFDTRNGRNNRKKYQWNYCYKQQIQENIANRFQISDEIRCENPDQTSDENSDEKQNYVAIVFPERRVHP